MNLGLREMFEEHVVVDDENEDDLVQVDDEEVLYPPPPVPDQFINTQPQPTFVAPTPAPTPPIVSISAAPEPIASTSTIPLPTPTPAPANQTVTQGRVPRNSNNPYATRNANNPYASSSSRHPKKLKLKLGAKATNSAPNASFLGTYDRELDSDIEEEGGELLFEEHFILRMPPGEDCEKLRKMVQNRDVTNDVWFKFKGINETPI